MYPSDVCRTCLLSWYGCTWGICTQDISISFTLSMTDSWDSRVPIHTYLVHSSKTSISAVYFSLGGQKGNSLALMAAHVCVKHATLNLFTILWTADGERLLNHRFIWQSTALSGVKDCNYIGYYSPPRIWYSNTYQYGICISLGDLYLTGPTGQLDLWLRSWQVSECVNNSVILTAPHLTRLPTCLIKHTLCAVCLQWRPCF